MGSKEFAPHGAVIGIITKNEVVADHIIGILCSGTQAECLHRWTSGKSIRCENGGLIVWFAPADSMKGMRIDFAFVDSALKGNPIFEMIVEPMLFCGLDDVVWIDTGPSKKEERS